MPCKVCQYSMSISRKQLNVIEKCNKTRLSNQSCLKLCRWLSRFVWLKKQIFPP